MHAFLHAKYAVYLKMFTRKLKDRQTNKPTKQKDYTSPALAGACDYNNCEICPVNGVQLMSQICCDDLVTITDQGQEGQSHIKNQKTMPQGTVNMLSNKKKLRMYLPSQVSN